VPALRHGAGLPLGRPRAGGGRRGAALRQRGFELLAPEGPARERARALLGDEREDYGAALERHWLPPSSRSCISCTT
jgi:hypothetical protein